MSEEKDVMKYVNLAREGKLKTKDVPVWIKHVGPYPFTHKALSKYGKKNPYDFIPNVWKPILHLDDAKFFKDKAEQGSKYFEATLKAPPKDEREEFNFADENKSVSVKIAESQQVVADQNGQEIVAEHSAQ